MAMISRDLLFRSIPGLVMTEPTVTNCSIPFNFCFSIGGLHQFFHRQENCHRDFSCWSMVERRGLSSTVPLQES